MGVVAVLQSDLELLRSGEGMEGCSFALMFSWKVDRDGDWLIIWGLVGCLFSRMDSIDLVINARL